MKRKHLLKYLISTVVIILLGWFILTLYVEGKGAAKELTFGHGEKKTIIIFDPDPFYNLDEQVCISFAKALTEKNINATVLSVVSAEKLQSESFDLYVYCANTYNWRPDWAITGFTEDQEKGKATKPVVAITLGGSTEASQRRLEKIITNRGSKLLGSYSLWIWRPNDEEKMEQPNVDVAVAMAYDWGKQIANKLNND